MPTSESPLRHADHEKVVKQAVKKKLGFKTSRQEKQLSVWQSQDMSVTDSLMEPSHLSGKGASVSINIDQHMKTTTTRFIPGHNPHAFDRVLGRGGFS